MTGPSAGRLASHLGAAVLDRYVESPDQRAADRSYVPTRLTLGRGSHRTRPWGYLGLVPGPYRILVTPKSLGREKR